MLRIRSVSLLLITAIFVMAVMPVSATDSTFIELRRLGVGSIGDMALNPDGTILAVASGASIRLYDAARLELLGLLEGHTNTVQSVDWSPDGEMLVSGSRDGTIRFWNPAQAEEIKRITLPGDVQWVLEVAWSPDGSKIAAAGFDFIIIVDVSTGEIIHARAGRTVVAWSPDGSMLAHGNENGSITLLSAENFQPLAFLEGQRGTTRLLWSPDGIRLAAATFDKIAYIWDTDTLSASFVSGAHQGSVLDIAWSDDGSMLITADGRYNLYLWEPQNSEPAAVWGATRESFADWKPFSIELSADGTTLFSGGANGLLEVWNMETYELERSLEGHDSRVIRVRWSPDGDYLASVGEDDRLYIWDTESWTPLASLICQTLIAGDLTWSPDGKRLALSCDSFITVLEVEAPFALTEIARIETSSRSVAWSPDGSKLVSGSYTGGIQIWDTESLTLLSEATVFSDLVPVDERPVSESVIDIEWSPNGAYFATATTTGRNLAGTVEVWDADGNSIRVFEGYFDVAWSADGASIASIEPILHQRERHVVTIRDVASGRPRLTTPNQDGAIQSIAWSPDNRYVVTSAWDRTVRFFDTVSGVELQTLTDIHRHAEFGAGIANDLAWSPDGLYLASAGDDGTIAILG